MTLNEVYYQKIELANKIRGLIQFTFEFENHLYLVRRGKYKWSDPIYLEKL